MEYKEFRVTVVDQNNIRATKPGGITTTGSVQMDDLKKSTINIFNNWLAKGKIENRKELVVLGSYLYGVLFSGKIDTEFKDTFDKIRQQPDTSLRMTLEFEQEARELATMPWEYIYFPDTPGDRGFFIATRGKLILTRHVPLNVALEDLQPREKPLRVLIVVSQHKDLGIVNAEPVIETIEELKNRLPDAIETDKLDQPTKRSFIYKVKNFQPHVLHFIGHGEYDKQGGRLAFVQEEDQKSVAWIGDLDLADCFQDFQPRLIFLHACEGATSESYEGFSGLALQLVYSKVPAVVAMQYPIENKVAIKFAKKFYQCLGEGKPIDVAVQEGRQELGMYLDEQNFSSRAFGSPVVYLQSEEGIIIAEAESEVTPRPLLEQKVRCPNRSCPGLVLSTDRRCGKCGDRLTPCPKCGEVMSEDVGICVKCGHEVGASPDRMDKAATGTTEPEATTYGSSWKASTWPGKV